MASDEMSRVWWDTRLTPRQRRLRVATVGLLVVLGMMVGFGVSHPFFRSAGPARLRVLTRQAALARRSGVPVPPEAARARRVVMVRLGVIGAYWTTCIVLSASLLVIAWLDIREVRRKLLRARRALVHDTVRAATAPRDSEDKA